MGKLVLFLADGSTVNVPLDKERLTIGRRADNDVCLPYPAVSGEHAAVVTILADSFLEDLGSTNGTLVNGKPVAKHFLVDHDRVDIGRQRFVYLSDDDAKVEPTPGDQMRSQVQGLADKVAPVRPPAAQGDGRGAAMASPGHAIEADIEAAASAGRSPAAGVAAPTRAPQGSPVAPPSSAPSAPAGAGFGASQPEGHRAAVSAARGQRVATGPSALPPLHVSKAVFAPLVAPRHGSTEARQADGAAALAPGPLPSVRVLSGPSIGRTLPLTKDELSIGRVGAQVAVVRRTPDGYRLVPLEGDVPPKINGAPVAPDGSPLHPGDTFEIAGIRLELSVDLTLPPELTTETPEL
jgi:pSer/pThr/pTyr-binding forkhead associated (FHA) protein